MTRGPLDGPRAALRPPVPAGERVMSLERLGDLVPDGATVAIGGTWLSSRPMAAVRELVRAGRRDLNVVSLTGSLDVDVLVGAGVASRVAFCFVSLGPFGLAPRFRAAAEDGSVTLDEHSGHGLTVALEAASRGLEFMPFFGPVGTTLNERYPTMRPADDSDPVQIVRALPVDVTLLHALAATPDGHVLLSGAVGVDVVTARAADRVIVTTERLVDRLPDSGSRYLSAAEVHVVIEAPWGGHPLAHVPDYGMDWRALLDYAEQAATPAGFRTWLDADLGASEADRISGLDASTRSTLQRIGTGGVVPA